MSGSAQASLLLILTIKMKPYPLAHRIFESLIPDSRIRVVDAGAAGAGEALRWGFLGSQLELHSFEADETECEKLNELAKSGMLIRNYNMFLGAPQKARIFYIAREFNNSFFPTDIAWYQRRRTYWKGPVVRTSDMYAVVKTIEVESVSLDDWAERAGASGVDYLKVDIEGAELELMQTSPRIMAGVLGVSTDVTFHADWIGAPTFADVDKWMVSNGFVLFDLQGVKRGTFFDTPVVAPRGHPVLSGQLACANAIYFRDPLGEGAAPMAPDSMLKLAAIAEVHGQVEFAFELVRTVGRLSSASDRVAIGKMEQAAAGEYARMLSGKQAAKWRNWFSVTARAVIPRQALNFMRPFAKKIGLGANPLYPDT